jgi:hypothetical protein
MTGICRSSANFFTGGKTTACPLPAALSGGVYTARIWQELRSKDSNIVAANCGVPIKTARIVILELFFIIFLVMSNVA